MFSIYSVTVYVNAFEKLIMVYDTHNLGSLLYTSKYVMEFYGRCRKRSPKYIIYATTLCKVILGYNLQSYTGLCFAKLYYKTGIFQSEMFLPNWVVVLALSAKGNKQCIPLRSVLFQ